MSVGFPDTLWLDEFGSMLWAAFGKPAYHVGSSLANKTGWRDVDVVMILDDADYDAMGFMRPSVQMHQDGKWRAYCLAFSELGRRMTGLPIDFKIQRQSNANEQFKGNRSAIGMVPLRLAAPPPEQEEP